MRIVQTFWSGGGNPLTSSFGWPHAEYNLMSWALSCCSLREHYDEIALYTDPKGYEILIEKLHLPYTEVNIIYDDNLCLPQHWAYAKIKTYSIQTKPFLHVDGDIYVPKPIPQSILNAALIAQNKEIGTAYYKHMMDRILTQGEFSFPEYIRKSIASETLESFNMGFFGGSDIATIHNYCQEAERFISTNQLNNTTNKNSLVQCNIFFEQIIFAAYIKKHKKNVASVLGHQMQDKGYTAHEFCALKNYRNASFFHILGGHKQTQTICDTLETILAGEYPDIYKRIVVKFPNRHPLLCDQSYNSNIDCKERLLVQEQKKYRSYLFLHENEERKDNWFVEKNPLVSTWNFSKNEMVCIIPSITWKAYESVPIKPLGENILSIINNKKIKYLQLKTQLMKYFSTATDSIAFELIDEEIQYMLHYGIITVSHNY